jgi:hypothetical protein
LKRIALPAVVAALAIAAIAAPAASAGTMTPAKTCATYSKNVTNPKVNGTNVKGTLTSSNVDPSQERYATCATAKKVMNRMLSLRIEMPKVTEGADRDPHRTRLRQLRLRL